MTEDLKTEVSEIKKPIKTSSRRSFLKALGVGAAALALKEGLDLTGDIWQPRIVHLGIDTLRNPEKIEDTLLASTNLLEGLAVKDSRANGAPIIGKNPSYKPMAEIIGEILDSRKKSGKPVKFRLISGYKDAGFYFDRYQEMIDDPKNRDRKMIEMGELSETDYFLGYKPGTLTDFFGLEHPIFPPEVVPVWEASDRTFSFSKNLVIQGGGIANYVIESLGPESEGLFDTSSNYWTYHQDEVNGVVRAYLSEVKRHIETIVAKRGPVSVAVIFDWFLDKNDGDIGSSLLDTMIFLKFMARQDTTFETFDEVKDDPELSRANENWFKANILDEYGKVGNYNKLPHETFPYHGALAFSPELANRKVDKDLHLLNQIGKPYHAWNIALLLTAIPPQIIQGGVMWRQHETFPEQGPVKTAADFRVALELSKIQEVLLQYQ